MKQVRPFILWSALSFIGCANAYDYVPPVGYDVSSIPRSSTAVVTTTANSLAVLRVASVDGKSACPTWGPCPPAVRLLPGSHELVVDVKALGGPIRSGSLPVPTGELKARHVYEVVISIAPDRTSASASLADLGEDLKIVDVEVFASGKFMLDGTPVEPELLAEAIRTKREGERPLYIHVEAAPNVPGPLGLRAYEAVRQAGGKSILVDSKAFQ